MLVRSLFLKPRIAFERMDVRVLVYFLLYFYNTSINWELLFTIYQCVKTLFLIYGTFYLKSSSYAILYFSFLM